MFSGTLRQKTRCWRGATGQCILFSVVFTPSPPGHHGSICVLPVIYAIPLLLSNTVSPVRIAYPYDGRGFVGLKKKTIVSLLVFLLLFSFFAG